MIGDGAPVHDSRRPQYRYRLCGRVLASAIVLPELEPANGGETDLELRLAPAQPRADTADDWFRRDRLDDGSPWLSIGHSAGGFLFRFHGLADFSVARDGARVLCHPLPGLPPATLRHLALDVVAPLALTLAGLTVVHAGAVASPEGAVVFVGPTGSGKSTLTAALAASGWPVVADDALVIEVGPAAPVCLPGYPGLRLWPDSLEALCGVRVEEAVPVAHYSSKKRFPLPADGRLDRDRPTPLRQLYLLGNAEGEGWEPRITRASRREVLLALLESQFSIDPGDPALARRSFEALARIVESTDVARLSYPMNFDRITELQPLIARHLGLEVGGHCRETSGARRSRARFKPGSSADC